eukprot:Ihof_evm2s272 gene=Ihof_evmTU2s272
MEGEEEVVEVPRKNSLDQGTLYQISTNDRGIKRQPSISVPNEGDKLTITPLGAGQEVGRSCCVIEFKGKKIMLDCGIHPGRQGLDALPFFDAIDPSTIELLIVSHFHLDHIGALPHFLEKTTFKGRVFMTHPTKSIYKWLLADSIRISNIAAEDMLFDEKDLDNSMEKIETMNFHQTVEVEGIKFTAYNAGHVLGAAMIELEIAGVKILYTGDYSREEDRHLMAAEIPPTRPDILIVESTYGVQMHEPRSEREDRFTNEYWEQHPELHNVPIYYASSLAKKCMAVYETYVHMMNERIRKSIAVANPFVFKHISNLKNMDHFDDTGASVVMASPGMLQNGLSRELFELWCPDPKNCCIIAGYSVDGTLARHIMTSPKEVTSLVGNKIPMRLAVHQISFSAHADFAQTRDFIDALLPPNIVLVHGDSNEMGRLKAELTRRFDERPDVNTVIHTPKNTQAVELFFRGEKLAKTIGSLADDPPLDGQTMSGVLVRKGFAHNILAPQDLYEYSGLVTSVIQQRLLINYHAPMSLLHHFLERMYGEVPEKEIDGKITYRIFDVILLTQMNSGCVMLEWQSDAINDMFADSVMAAVLQVESNPVSVKLVGSRCSHSTDHLHSKGGESSDHVVEEGEVVDKTQGIPLGIAMRMFKEQFGVVERHKEDDERLTVMVDESVASVWPSRL